MKKSKTCRNPTNFFDQHQTSKFFEFFFYYQKIIIELYGKQMSNMSNWIAKWSTNPKPEKHLKHETSSEFRSNLSCFYKVFAIFLLFESSVLKQIQKKILFSSLRISGTRYSFIPGFTFFLFNLLWFFCSQWSFAFFFLHFALLFLIHTKCLKRNYQIF